MTSGHSPGAGGSTSCRYSDESSPRGGCTTTTSSSPAAVREAPEGVENNAKATNENAIAVANATNAAPAWRERIRRRVPGGIVRIADGLGALVERCPDALLEIVHVSSFARSRRSVVIARETSEFAARVVHRSTAAV